MSSCAGRPSFCNVEIQVKAWVYVQTGPRRDSQNDRWPRWSLKLLHEGGVPNPI